MIESYKDIAQAAIEASFLLRHRSIAGNVAFRREIDHSRRVIAQSRELLKRIRERQRDDSRAWEDDRFPLPSRRSMPTFCALCFEIWSRKRRCPSVNGAIWPEASFTSLPAAIWSRPA
ncbi:hypothetical protein [Mesorhizobium sp. ES1-6]|uniref:hypothetical protein n=1 Tax=Mesorhizobium sp. ES1-6 TaxID=2876626 RepID=UPI001CCF80ED|nr:hypothetical protein [Mesorhizobium sp. ES1-6]MBZ9804785.1 hypothetical protein [Mesorhizobium sp. ES1-6]